MSYWRLSIIILLIITGTSLAQEVTPEAMDEGSTEIEFTIFTHAETDIKGIAAIGWEEVLAGSYLNPDNDSSYILHFASDEVNLEELLQPILEAFLQETLPEEFDSHEQGDITWTLYNFEYIPTEDSEPLVVNIATAEYDGLARAVILQSSVDDYEYLHDALFLPSVNYFGQTQDVIESELNITSLIPETIIEFGIDTVIPRDWENANPGSYIRGDLQVDPTTLIIQTSSDLSEDEFRGLFLERLNIAELGDGEVYISDYLEWTFYMVDIDIDGTLLTWQIATASDEDFAYLTVLFSFADERDTLGETILLAVLDETRQSE